MEEVRIGFIGCGGNANGHMNTLSSLEKTRIVSVCDLQEERVQNAAKRHQAVDTPIIRRCWYGMT